MNSNNNRSFPSPYPLLATVKLLYYSCIPIQFAGEFEVIEVDANTCKFQWCYKKGLFRRICDLVSISRYGRIIDNKVVVYGKSSDFFMELTLEPRVEPNGSVVVNTQTVCIGDRGKCNLFSEKYTMILSLYINSMPSAIAQEIFKFRVKEAPGQPGTMETPEKPIDEELLRRGLTSAYMALSVEGVAYILRKSPETHTIVLRAGWRVGDLLEYIRGEARKYREYQLILVKLRIPILLDVWLVVDTSGDVIAWRGLIRDRERGVSWPEELYRVLGEFTGEDIEVTIWIAPWKRTR